MPVITFEPSKKTIDVPLRTNLMEAIIQAELPIGSSCGASAVCARCFVKILKGNENLSKPTEHEKELLIREKFDGQTRISCLTKVLGPITITTTYW